LASCDDDVKSLQVAAQNMFGGQRDAGDDAMYEGKRIIATGGLAAVVSLCSLILATVLPCGASAQQTAATSPKAHELATALAQEWLKEQGEAKSAAPPVAQTNQSFGDYVNSSAGAFHDQIVALAGAIPDLPNQFDRAFDRVTAIDADSGKGQVFLDLGMFGDKYRVATRRLAAGAQAVLNLVLIGACGFGAQWLFRRMTEGVRRRLTGLPMENVNDRLRVIITRFALTFGVITAFVAGILGPLLAFDMDPVRRTMVSGLLIVFVAIWIAIATGNLLLAPNDERFRIIPMDTAAARFWYRRFIAFTGSFTLVWVVIQECGSVVGTLGGRHWSTGADDRSIGGSSCGGGVTDYLLRGVDGHNRLALAFIVSIGGRLPLSLARRIIVTGCKGRFEPVVKRRPWCSWVG
jgi:hypothetical protein